LIVGSVLAPTLVRWMQPAFVVGAGLVCAAVGLVVLTEVDVVSGLAVVVTGSIIVSLGVAVVIPLTTEMIVWRPGPANRENPTRTVSVLNGKDDVHDRVLANRGSQPT
jgi:hypothetical protein